MTKKNLNILITNDDGIHAPGIQHLWKALAPHVNLSIVAPETEQSATGLSITTSRPLLTKRHDWGSCTAAWSVSGTPADCVKLGLSAILNHKPHLIVSGINRGSNAGRNILYSGTVGAAIEGVLQGIPSIAFSCYDFYDTDYSRVEKYLLPILFHVVEHPLPKGTLLNVNFPKKSIGSIAGFKMTRQGKERWKESPDKRIHPVEKEAYFWLGAELSVHEEEEDCDISWLSKGYVAAVPIHVGELTDHDHVMTYRDQFEQEFLKE